MTTRPVALDRVMVPSAVIAVDPSTGLPMGGSSNPSYVSVPTRSCLGMQIFAPLNHAAASSLTVPVGAVAAEIQADGGVVRIRLDATAPTATTGWKLEDVGSLSVASNLANVRLLAHSASTNCTVAYFDRC